MHIKPILRDIDTDKGFHIPSLRMRAYPGRAVGVALATVRAEETGG